MRAQSPSRIALTLVCITLGSAPYVAAEVVRVDVKCREAFADGARFGQSGAYESLSGRIYFEADPTAVLNARITDIDLAPQNPKGRVEFWADFFLLRPVDPHKGNGCLLYEVHNRGDKLALRTFNDAAISNAPSTASDAGNGFLMRAGYSLLWTGWSGDVAPDGTGRLLAGLPIAKNPDGTPITGPALVEVVVDEPKFSEPFFYSPWGASAAYPTVALDDPAAVLTRREAGAQQRLSSRGTSGRSLTLTMGLSPRTRPACMCGMASSPALSTSWSTRPATQGFRGWAWPDCATRFPSSATTKTQPTTRGGRSQPGATGRLYSGSRSRDA